MKKNIFIVRHGHAEFSAAQDYDRILTNKGIKAVNKASDFIHKTCQDMNLSVELCISSAAKRTQQTAEIICSRNLIPEVVFHAELYSTVTSRWLEKISNAKQKNIVIVGHNPTFSQMVNSLCGHEFYMKPAHCAFISLEIKEDGIIYPAQLIKIFQNE